MEFSHSRTSFAIFLVPLKQIPQYHHLVQKYPLLAILDGRAEIQHLPGYSEETREEVYETLNYAFYERVISFKNTLEPKDYVVATPLVRSLIPEKAPTRVQFQDLFPGIDLMHLVLDLEQVCRIDKLGYDQEDNLIPALEWMFNENMIQIIGEVPRKLFISIDIADNLLEILHKLAGQKNIEWVVRKIIFNRGIPGLAGRIQFHEGRIMARIDKFLLLIEKPEEISQFAQQWILFAQELVVEFYPVFKEKFITQFYNLLVEQYLNVIHKRDLDLLTPILTKLEELHVE